MNTTLTDSNIRSRIRAQLPKHIWKQRPWDTLWLLLAVGIWVAGDRAILHLAMERSLKITIAIVLGNLLGSFFFFGHHLLHGSFVRSKALQDLLMFPCTAALGLSPHLWRVWHHHAHHPNTNHNQLDPDHFGTYANYRQRKHASLFLFLSPGHGRWLASFVYLCFFFPVQAQAVLWSRSKMRTGLKDLSRSRAALETLGIGAFWLALWSHAGLENGIYVVAIPCLVANLICLSYIVTQHMLRPLDGAHTLATTMSVAVAKWVDILHWRNSHHVEHHLFPLVAPKNLPLIRKILLREFPDEYLAPPFFKALTGVINTPRLHDGKDLVDPWSGKRVSFSTLNLYLRGKIDQLEPCYPFEGQMVFQ